MAINVILCQNVKVFLLKSLLSFVPNTGKTENVPDVNFWLLEDGLMVFIYM